MKTQRTLFLFIGGLVLLSGCTSRNTDPIGSITELMAPAPENSGEPNLSVGGSGKAYLTWIETADDNKASLKFASKTPEGWSEARTVAQSYNMFKNWADVPSLSELSAGVLAAHWQVSSADADEGYSVNVAVSQDEGKTWGKPVTPHRDGSKGEHGFVSMTPSPATNGVSVIWLDSRKLKGDEGDVALMRTNIGVDGTLGDESEIDPRVCECCQPTAIPVSGGMLAVYRDRTPDEIRDIVISRFDGSKWSEPKTVFDDKWKIFACPIQGPAIAAAGDNIAVAWFTAANDKPRVQAAFSKDGGKTFGAPVQVDDGNPIGRVDIAALENGNAVVSWIEHSTNGGEIRARHVGSDGKKNDAHTVAKTSVGNASGFPRLERIGNEFVFAWTDTDAHRVRTAIGKP